MTHDSIHAYRYFAFLWRYQARQARHGKLHESKAMVEYLFKLGADNIYPTGE